ncbi:GTPase ObgE [Desulfonatronovibrio magnus]|uniref:GTPase ObgE n=1 Tax=Desulfonatronovibrio magnus TaxID=698827 RepID=UPI0005EBBEFE
MRFVDEAEITVRSGKGGNGCVSFRREKFIPRGGPDGGDGGRGGDVYFQADDKLLTLYDFKHKRVYEAQNGRPGMGRQRFGGHGQDLIVKVPPGTQVYEIHDDRKELLADLVQDGQQYCIAQGGTGGKGNAHFKSSTMRAPRFAQPGQEGRELRIRLELKVIADAGVIGLPNAGKSTFLTRVSAARPKIGAYPFTTLTPNLGVLDDDRGTRMVMADIPGLIEGAHEGHGLGDRFLKHVERTRFLVHLLSVDDLNPEFPMEGFDLINRELARFSTALASKEQILVVNKIDLVNEQEMDIIKSGISVHGDCVFFISALNGTGIDELMQVIWAKFYNSQDFT